MDDDFSKFADSLSEKELLEMYDAMLEEFKIQDDLNKNYYERKRKHGK